MAESLYWKAVNRALDEELARDERVVLFGEDTALPGGVFGVTRDLAAKYGDRRVLDAPISENAFVGAAVGAAAAGLRPVAELMFMDFSLVAADQLINHAAKIRYLTQGAYGAPLVIRVQQGVTTGSSAQHTQSLEALFCSIPGLRVVAAATPASAYGMLKTAIRDDDPVIFIEHRGLYMTKGDLPDEEYLTPIDQAHVVREGDDVTIVSWLASVAWAETVADGLSQHGISAEVVDLRSLSPIDYATVEASVAKTGRAARPRGHPYGRPRRRDRRDAARARCRFAEGSRPTVRRALRADARGAEPAGARAARIEEIVAAVAAPLTKTAA